MPRIQLASSLFFMLLSLVIGVFRLMNLHSINIYPWLLTRLYSLHPNIMLFGFLAPIIMTERYVGSKAMGLNLIGRYSSRLMAPITQAGLLLQILSYLFSTGYLMVFGGIAITLGLLLFILLLLQLSSKTGVRLPFYFMILSVIPLQLFNILFTEEKYIQNPSQALLLLLFPVIFILGERIELTRFLTTGYSVARFMVAFFGCLILVLVSSLGSIFFHRSVEDRLLLIFFILLLLVGLAVLAAETGSLRKGISSPLLLQRYVAKHIVVAYVWLILSAFFGFAFVSDLNGLYYDAMIHSMTVGFIGTMLLAHGPVIIPSVISKRVDVSRLTLYPLFILTISNIMRIIGDLAIGNGFGPLLNILSGSSGWLILLAVLTFISSLIISSPASE
jgi:hypothetical protein